MNYTFKTLTLEEFDDLRYKGKKFFNKKFSITKSRKKALSGTITIKPRRGQQWDKIDFVDLVSFAWSNGLGLNREDPRIVQEDFANFSDGIEGLVLYRREKEVPHQSPSPIFTEKTLPTPIDENPSSPLPEDASEEIQLPYIPKSQAPAIGTLISTNLRDAVNRALANLVQEVGDIDQYVAIALSYTMPDLHRCFAAEQIDALGLAIWNIKRGKALVLGDETGVGKGRVLAGIIRYALVNNLIPIFCTDNEKLYADIIRDIEDIGIGAFNPFVTNRNLSIPLRSGEVLKSDPELERRLNERDLSGYDAIFTTYYQLSSVKGESKPRHDFLEHFAHRSLLILDESHQAGGKANVKQFSSRGLFARLLADNARGVIYSSATFAKYPESLTLYTRTDMADAVGDMEKLIQIIESGGIPLQQALAADLAAAGQYLRRERSYTGVDFTPLILPGNRELAEKFSFILAEIMKFDFFKQDAVRILDEALKKQAASIARDNAIGEIGASSVIFTAIAHNLIDQFLLAIKADDVVELALLALERGEKPVIAVANTMGAAIERYAKERELAPGDEINITFADLLLHYLEQTRRVLVKDATGSIYKQYLSDWQLGKRATEIYDRTAALIKSADFEKIPASPIDHILARLAEHKVKAGELTGRSHTIRIMPHRQYYKIRTLKERSKGTAVQTVLGFNEGKIDTLIVNRSATTGISLHASKLFTDKRCRHLIIAQAEKNINDFIQLLGRIHRTGQVVLPRFTLLLTDLPAEKRPGAILCRKLASLNANTTAHRQNTGIKLDGISDFMNNYGDLAAFEVLNSQPMLHEALGEPLKDFEVVGGALAKVTGRIPLLPTIDEQEWAYELIEQQYKNILEANSSIEGNGLEVNLLPGVLLSSESELVRPLQRGNSPFHSSIVTKEFEVCINRSPYPKERILQMMNIDCPKKALLQGRQIVDEYLANLKPDLWNYINSQSRLTTKLQEKLNLQCKLVTELLKELPPGRTVEVLDPIGNIWYGVIGKITATPSKGKRLINPVAPSRWQVKIYTANANRELTLSFSNLTSENGFTIRDGEASIWEDFDLNQGEWRQVRHICTGNLLYACSQFSGKVVKFLDRNKVNYGLLLPYKYNPQAVLAKQPVKLKKVEEAWHFLSDATNYNGVLTSTQQDLLVKTQFNRGVAGSFQLLLETQKSKRVGSKYYLDKQLLEAMGIQFYSVGNSMRATVERPENIKETLQVLLNMGLLAKNNLDVAKRIVEKSY